MHQAVVGRVYDQEGCMLAETRVYLEHQAAKFGRMESWSGRFKFEDVALFRDSGPFQLELVDGRRGDFVVSNTEEQMINFVGSGPLQ